MRGGNGQLTELAGTSSDGSELFTEQFRGHLEDAGARSGLLRVLIHARRRLGLSQRALAERMGTTQSAVSELERGGQDPRLSTLQRYARGVDCALHLALHIFNVAGTPGLWPVVDQWMPLAEAGDIVPSRFDVLEGSISISALPPLDEFTPVEGVNW
ncbi:MAG: helix-turn-helix domain-containing protein [Acidimicrobiales bacterium]